VRNWTRILECLAEWNLPAATAVRWRVKAFIGLGMEDEALGACQEWLRSSPDNPQALWELTRLEVAREGLDAVRVRFGRLARIPSRPPVYREIYASLCRRAGKIEEAVGQYEKLTAAGGDVRIQRKQAFALAKAGQEMEAIPVMEELLRVDPRDFYLHSAYKAACRRVHDLERARRFYQELTISHPDEKALYGSLRRINRELEAKA
jgi:tetratricopeptide (TPR) repeat protein